MGDPFPTKAGTFRGAELRASVGTGLDLRWTDWTTKVYRLGVGSMLACGKEGEARPQGVRGEKGRSRTGIIIVRGFTVQKF